MAKWILLFSVLSEYIYHINWNRLSVIVTVKSYCHLFSDIYIAKMDTV